MNRQSGQLEISYYKNFGGSAWDSIHYADMFRAEAPHHFGMQVSRLFSAKRRYDNKVLTNMTYARGNHMSSTTDVYKWTLAGDSYVDFRIVDFVETGNNYIGKGLSTFRFVADKGWLHEPDVVQFEDNRYSLVEIVGAPVQYGTGWLYTARLQTSDPNEFIDPSQLQIGMTFCKTSTSIVTEMNNKRGTDQYSSMMDLQCQIGAFGEEFSITDKVVRMEMAASKRGQDLNNLIPEEQRTSQGYAFTIRQGDKVIPRGAFITMAEDRLLERVDMDAEVAMVFGTNSNIIDPTTNRVKKTAPGIRQLQKDGHIMYHNGGLTAKMIEDYLHGIFLHRNGMENRKISLVTGEGGIRLFDQILSEEASAFLTLDTNFIKPTTSSFNSNALQFGSQFTKFIAKNGIEVELVYDPVKDDRMYCKRRHPDNPNFTIDSFRMDIMDFGMSDGQNNISSISEDNVDMYAYAANLVDPRTGVISSGARVASLDKGIVMAREISRSIWVKDTSRIGAIVFEPEA